VSMKRMATEEIADKRKMLELFTLLENFVESSPDTPLDKQQASGGEGQVCWLWESVKRSGWVILACVSGSWSSDTSADDVSRDRRRARRRRRCRLLTRRSSSGVRCSSPTRYLVLAARCCRSSVCVCVYVYVYVYVYVLVFVFVFVFVFVYVYVCT